MEKDLKLLEKVIRSGNRLMLKQVCESNNYSDEDIQKICHDMGIKVVDKLRSQGRIMDIDSLEKLISQKEAENGGC